MKCYSIIVLLLCIITSNAHGTEHYQTLFQKANNAYSEGDYTAAKASYAEIIEAGFTHPDLTYNLANSYFKLNEPIKAILYYEKTLKANPGHKDALHNLKLANSQTIDKIDALPTAAFADLQEWISTLISISTWTLLAFVFLLAALATTGLFLLGKSSKIKRLGLNLTLLMSVLWGLTVALGTAQKLESFREDSAIIFETSVHVKSEPTTNGSDLFVIHEGLKVRILQQQEQFVEIQLPDGNTGWVKRSALEVI